MRPASLLPSPFRYELDINVLKNHKEINVKKFHLNQKELADRFLWNDTLDQAYWP